MQTLISIIIALIIFSVLVLIHEFGHFIVAKKCGVVVNEFSVGMGPRLLSRVAKSGTRYSIKALPFGGSCAMLGEDEDKAVMHTRQDLESETELLNITELQFQ